MNKVNQSGKKIQSVSGKVKEVLLSSPQYDRQCVKGRLMIITIIIMYNFVKIDCFFMMEV